MDKALHDKRNVMSLVPLRSVVVPQRLFTFILVDHSNVESSLIR
jgi:hypothetical protein